VEWHKETLTTLDARKHGDETDEKTEACIYQHEEPTFRTRLRKSVEHIESNGSTRRNGEE